jgi:glutaredoxin
MAKLKSVHVVYADWCPHCVPTAVDPVKNKAVQIGIPCILYHVDDHEACKKADDLVKRYGDWSEDYLIPQVFLEYENGEIRHVFTGYSEDIQLTKTGLDNLLKSDLFRVN